MLKTAFLIALGLSSVVSAQVGPRSADGRAPGYQREATGDLQDFTCGQGDATFTLTQLAARRVQAQAESYIANNRDFRGCRLVEEEPLLESRRPDFVDPAGGVSRFFVFQGRVSCGGFLGLFPREIKIPRVVQHYRHPTDATMDRCL